MENKESDLYKTIQKRRIAHASEALRKVLNEEIYQQELTPEEALTAIAHISAGYIRLMQQKICPNDKYYVEGRFILIINELLDEWEQKSPSPEAVKTDMEAN